MLKHNLVTNQNLISKFVRVTSFLLFLMVLSSGLMAQASVEINNQDVGSWFSRNWMWVVGGVVLLLLIILLSSKSRGVRKTTTVVKDTYGNVKSVTTTEEKP